MRYRRLMDPAIQGAVWGRNPEWSKLFKKHRTTPGEFAALVGNISCTVTSARLDKRLDVDGLAAKAQQRVEDLVDQIEQVDRVPRSAQTRESSFTRTKAVIRLGQAVALWEFAEMLRQVPAENRVLVRRYSKSLKPLLAAAGSKDPIVELRAWIAEQDEVQQATHVQDAAN
jgi:hypothetical protein